MNYILDVSKWRCGGNGPNSLGEGSVLMLNQQGYMCCLGQFAKQAGVSDESLLYRGSPRGLELGDYDPNMVVLSSAFQAFNSEMAESLMRINDNISTTPAEKIEAIKEVLESHGHTLTVINNLL